MSNDLNDILHFARIVEHGSLSAASEALGVAKSVLSQHLARLEERLGVRLIHRTTRKLQVTEIGMRYYERCRIVLEEVARSEEIIEDARGVPRGVVRVSSPVNFAHAVLAPVLADFMLEYPEIEIVLDVTNREVDLVAEGYDVALRIAPAVRASNYVVRSFSVARHLLVASPDFVATHGMPLAPEALRGLPSIAGLRGRGDRHVWRLSNEQGGTRAIAHSPRLVAEDLIVLRHAALSGCGIAELPPICCRDDLAEGALVRVLPQWSLPEMHLYAMFPSRNSLSLAVRSFIDYLSSRMHGALDTAIEGTMRFSVVGGTDAKAASLRRVC